ncbi:hypothetical protein BH09ACT6_BH09ACT6_24470 [soil metagenome]
MKFRSLHCRLTIGILAVGLVASALVVVSPLGSAPARALSGSSFDPGNIVSDAVFFDSSALSEGQTQNFLNVHGSNCAGTTAHPCLKDFAQSTAGRASSAYCSAYNGQASESAAQIIVRVGVACGINPQVLLVMLQKEQGLVDAYSTTDYMYRSAMGYGCPDTAACDSTYYGFFNQVYSAASQFQRYSKNSSSWSYQPGRNNNILYNPNPACGSSPVFIQNQATANLYIYTPYQPNAAALSNLYGSGDGCSAYGNRNFWVYFNSWFGDPTGGGLRNGSFETNTADWGPGNGFVNRAGYNNASIAKAGSWFFAANTPVAGRSIAQDVQRTVNVGDQATATIWLRSASSTPFSGGVALWGLGGVTEGAVTPYTVTDTWQQITVTLPVRQTAHSVVRFEIYMDSTDGTVFLDNAALAFGQGPPVKNLLSSPGFEGYFGGWVPGNGFVNQAIYQDQTLAHTGSWFAATNTAVAGRSLAQQVSAKTSVGDRYSFSIWVRAADPGLPVTGRLALWGLGGSSPFSGGTDFTAGAVWSRVTVTTDISQTGVTTLKPEIYMSSTGRTLFVDDGLLAKNLLTAGSFENGSFQNWGPGKGTINQVVYLGTAAGVVPQNGAYFAATNTAVAGNSLAQTVPRVTYVGDRYTAEVWLRASDQGKTFSGTLALWGLGGTAEVGATDFTVGTEWTRVTIDLPVSQGGHTSLKFEIYETSTDNTLFVDGAQVY